MGDVTAVPSAIRDGLAYAFTHLEAAASSSSGEALVRMNAPERPMTIGEIADRTVTAVVRVWPQLLMLLMLAELPAIVFACIGVINRISSGLGALLILLGICWAILSLIITPAQIALVNGADDMRSFGAAMQYGTRNFWVTLRCGILAAVTAGIAFGIVGAIGAAVSRMGAGGAGLVITVLIGGVLLAPLFLVVNIMFPIAFFETGHATPAFAIAWRRTIGTDLRRSWLLGVTLGIVGEGPGYIVGLLDHSLVSLTHVIWIGTVVSAIVGPVGELARSAFSTVTSRDLRVRAEGADLEDALDDIHAS
jgi:hypothetical protein